MKEELIYKYNDMENLIGKSRSTVWRMIKAGLIPRPIYTGNIFIGWRQSTIVEWLDSCEKEAA
jgi:prophage regulatory protein